MRSRFAAVALALVACLGFCPPALAQMSDAVHHDRVVTGRAGAGAKFLERKALPDAHDDEEATRPRDHCPANLRLRWMTEVSSSVYSTPVVADLFDDGHREILVPSFVHHLEVLEGDDGAKAGGDWPVFHASTAHASPLVHDFGSARRRGDPPPAVRRRGEVLRPARARRRRPRGPPRRFCACPRSRCAAGGTSTSPRTTSTTPTRTSARTTASASSAGSGPRTTSPRTPRTRRCRETFSPRATTRTKPRRRVGASSRRKTRRGPRTRRPGRSEGPIASPRTRRGAFPFSTTRKKGAVRARTRRTTTREAATARSSTARGLCANPEETPISTRTNPRRRITSAITKRTRRTTSSSGRMARARGTRAGPGRGRRPTATERRKPLAPRGAPADLPGHGEGVPDVGPRDKTPPRPRTTPREPAARNGGGAGGRTSGSTTTTTRARARGEDEREGEFVHVDAHLLCTPSVADVDGDGRAEIVLSVSYFSTASITTTRRGPGSSRPGSTSASTSPGACTSRTRRRWRSSGTRTWI